jgi:hypothetical protein
MKLRIRGNSIRVRVSQSELEQLAREGAVEDSVRFAPGSRLTYRVRVSTAEPLSAQLRGGEVTITLPKASLERWLEPAEVSIAGEQPIEAGETLRILIEKDFACLAPREGEDETDLFPNPAQGAC